VTQAGVGGGVQATAFDGEQLRMVLGNTLQAVEDGRQELLAFFERHDLDAMVVNRIEVVFEELISNTIRHGFRPGSPQSIHVQVKALPEGVELLLEDDGTPFDPFAAPSPAPLTTLADAPLGGLGIPLVTRLSADRRYERPGPAAASDGFAPSNRVWVVIATPAKT
jgi:anti-sigma regulatory factor (Ser/Thr protein kinase)